MRVVLDTNVLIAAFISHGTCHEILEHCLHHHQLVTSSFILEEFGEKLRMKFGYLSREVREAVRILRLGMEVVEPPPLAAPACRDRDDDNILAAAIAGNCHCIVTGDRDMLELKRHEGVVIVSPQEFWRLE